MDDYSAVVIISPETNVYYNLAVEKLLLLQNFSFPILFLWQSANAVVIGANQNPYAECNLENMQKDGVQLSRRITGGGAVYHDIGNLNFCFITPKENYNESKQFQVILSALQSFGITATLSGRNDILVNGLKVSGSAYYKGKKTCLHHGTLLVTSTLNKVNKYLTPSREKLEKHGVKSVASRVTNLSLFSDEISVKVLLTRLYVAFCEVYGKAKQLEAESFLTLDQINTEIKFISSEGYLYAKWKQNRKEFAKRKSFDWGILSAFVNLDENGVVTSIELESDCMYPQAIFFARNYIINEKLSELTKLELSDKSQEGIINDIIEFIKE